MDASSLRALQALLPLIALNECGFRSSRHYPSKTTCIECNCKIPPGKAGRKCEECRKKKTN